MAAHIPTERSVGDGHPPGQYNGANGRFPEIGRDHRDPTSRGRHVQRHRIAIGIVGAAHFVGKWLDRIDRIVESGSNPRILTGYLFHLRLQLGKLQLSSTVSTDPKLAKQSRYYFLNTPAASNRSFLSSTFYTYRDRTNKSSHRMSAVQCHSRVGANTSAGNN